MTYEILKEFLEYRDGNLYWRKKIGKRICVGYRAGADRPDGYRHVRINKKFYQEHILIWWLHYGERPASIIDHINMIRNDNRIDNLRLATRYQNAVHAPAPASNTSGHKGVSLNKKSGKYVAYLSINGTKKHLGTFTDFNIAASTHEFACKKYHGEFAEF